MAKILDDKSIIDAQIQENLNNALHDYSSLFDQSPMYITYYNKKVSASSQDAILDTVYQVAGSESPVRFNRIERFPLYNLDQLSLDLSSGNYGATADVTVPAIVLPGTIIPFPDDFFCVPYDNNGIPAIATFQVTAVSKSILGSKRYYQLQAELSTQTPLQLDEMLAENGDLEFNSNDFQNNKKPILVRSTAETLRRARSFRRQLANFYKMFFYKRSFSAFMCSHEEGMVVNYFSHLFIEETKAMEFDSVFFDSTDVLLYPPNEWQSALYVLIENTLYAAVQNHDKIANVLSEYFTLIEENSPNVIFASFPGEYYSLQPTCPGNTMGVTYSTPGFLEAIKTNTKYNTPDRKLEDFIIGFINNELEDPNTQLNLLVNVDITPAWKCFMLSPIVMYALRAIEDNIVRPQAI
jgi:hypothetical protein